MIPALLITVGMLLQGQTFANPALRSAGMDLAQQASKQATDRQLSEIVANQPEKVVANKPFTLIVVYDPRANDQATQWLMQVMRSPQTREFADWLAKCDVRGIATDSPHVEKVRWHLAKHQQLPVLMLAESPGMNAEGATWYSAGGDEIPLNETALALELQRWYTATVMAAKNSSPVLNSNNSVQEILPTQSLQYPDNYVFPRRTSNQFSGERRPLINPRVDITVPDSINTKVEASFKPETIRGLLVVGFTILATGIAIGYAMIHSARIIGEAITDDPQDQGGSPNGP